MWATLHAFEHNNLDGITLIPAPKCGQTRFDHGRRRKNIDQRSPRFHNHFLESTC